MNQLKSKRDSSPAREARDANRISSPFQLSVNSSKGSQVGSGSEGRWISTRVAVSLDSTRPRMPKPPSRSRKMAGTAILCKRSGRTRRRSAASPRRRAACNIAAAENSPRCSPHSCRSCCGSDAMPCARAIVTRHTSPEGSGLVSSEAVASSEGDVSIVHGRLHGLRSRE